MPRFMHLVLIGALFGSRSAEAQRVIAVGDTVQVQVAPGTPKVQGVVREAAGGELRVVDWAGAEQHLAAPHITRLQVLQGRRPATGRGALIGLAVGGTIGALMGLAATADQSGFITFGPEIIPVAAAVMGAIGVVPGTIIGSLSQRDHWVPGQLPPSAPAGVAHSNPRITPVVMTGAESTWKLGVRLR